MDVISTLSNLFYIYLITYYLITYDLITYYLITDII